MDKEDNFQEKSYLECVVEQQITWINLDLQDLISRKAVDLEVYYKEIEQEDNQYKYIEYQINEYKIMVEVGEDNGLYGLVSWQLVN